MGHADMSKTIKRKIQNIWKNRMLMGIYLKLWDSRPQTSLW